MGMNFQDVIRDVHDPANHQLKVAASVSASNQVTVQPLSAWPDPKGYIGLVTITGSLAAASGNVTLDAGSRTGIVGNITLSDPKGFIGLVTVVGSLSPAAGNVTLDAGSRTGILGNVTLSNPNTYIGLTTSTLGAGTQFIGLTTVVQASSARTITGNITLSNPNTYIGLTTSTLGIGTQFIGLATVVQASSARTITGNITLSNPNAYIGLTTSTLGTGTSNIGSVSILGGGVGLNAGVNGIGFATVKVDAGTQFIGLVTVVQSSSARTITGNVTLSDAKTYIGLVTATPSWGSEATVYATVISSSGNTTLFVAPASNRFFVKDLHVSSLGRSEIQFLSGATIFIPLTSLATTSGFAAFYGEMGKPARAATDALVANLNGAATVSIGVTYRIAP